MAVFKTSPVFFCRVCGKPLHLAIGMTYDDPYGENLHIVAKAAGEMAYCRYHMEQRKWYADQGRLADFEAGRP